jgi:tetratricopeptide (TPR) repeat protein
MCYPRRVVAPTPASYSRSGSASVETLVDDGDDAEGVRVEAGQRLGRYVTIECVGKGGMGVVWSAYDPDLDRRVALKVVRPRGRSPEREAAARTRLLREAQAMARLSHPNVVGIHDVGTVEDQVFLAMEYVPGGTLREWTKADERPAWSAIVTKFAGAAAGLQAAHDAGLVHRDFKPENVLLRADGRPQVVDFGLVRAAGTTEELGAEAFEPEGRGPGDTGPMATPVTRVGAVMGTPLYMSPEQHAGRPADERSDQFGFAVALYEALYGSHPFAGKTMVALVQRTLDGAVAEPPAESDVPAWLRRVVLRGLAVDPEHRWPSMRAFAAVLRADPRRVRRRRLALAGGVLGVVGLTAVAWMAGARGSSPVATAAVCDGDADRLETVWSESIRGELRAGLEGIDVSYATGTANGVERVVDRWIERWRDRRIDACRAARVDKTQSMRLHDHRVACLERGLRGMETRLQVVREVDVSSIARAVDVVAAAASPAACDDPSRQLDAPESIDDPVIRAEVSQLVAAIDRADAYQNAGRFDDAQSLAQRAFDRAVELELGAVQTRALHQLARLALRRDELENARQHLIKAGWIATGIGDDLGAFLNWVLLVDLVGDDLRESGWEMWVDASEAALRRAGYDRGAKRGMLDNAIGSVHEGQGRYTEALEAWESAYGQLMTSASGEEHTLMPHLLNNLGIAHLSLGHRRRAIEFLERALDSYGELYGEEHPDVAVARNNLGSALEVVGEHDRAIAVHRRGLADLRAALGETHGDVLDAWDHLGNALDARGDWAEAEAAFRKELELRLQVAPDSMGVAIDESRGCLDHLGPLGGGRAPCGRRSRSLRQGAWRRSPTYADRRAEPGRDPTLSRSARRGPDAGHACPRQSRERVWRRERRRDAQRPGGSVDPGGHGAACAGHPTARAGARSARGGRHLAG